MTLLDVCSDCIHLCHVLILLSLALSLAPLLLFVFIPDSRFASLFSLTQTSMHYCLPSTSNIRCVQHRADATSCRFPFTDRCVVSYRYCAVVVRCIAQYRFCLNVQVSR